MVASRLDLVSPYHADDKERILGSVVWKPDIDQEKLFRTLQLGAIQYQHDRPDRPFSKQLEFWKSVASSLSDVRQRIEGVLGDSFLYLEIETAIASRESTRKVLSSHSPGRPVPPAGCVWTPPPPDIPSIAPSPQDVPEAVRDMLTKARDALRDLQALIEETCSFAASQKTSRTRDGAGPSRKAAGKTADKALHSFVGIIGSLYWRHAAKPRRPAQDRADSEKASELVVFLDACLRPTGLFYDGPAGIVSLWHRAKKSMPRGWPEAERH